jgi:hypothetical protein
LIPPLETIEGIDLKPFDRQKQFTFQGRSAKRLIPPLETIEGVDLKPFDRQKRLELLPWPIWLK